MKKSHRTPDKLDACLNVEVALKSDIALIDHYDSFTFNLIDWLKQSGLQVLRVSYDDADLMAEVRLRKLPLVLSPGPKSPEDVPETLDLVAEAVGNRPVFGICLGHQILGHLAGLTAVRSKKPFHGAVRKVSLLSSAGLMQGLPQSFDAACYHSLTLSHLSGALRWPVRVDALDALEEIQAVVIQEDSAYPAYGVQFHPESFMGDELGLIRENWLAQVKAYLSDIDDLIH